MSMMSFRTDEADKLAFLDLCKSMEVSPSQVLRTAMKQMVETKRLPIHKQQWDENPETLEAIRELETGGGTRYPNYETMMKDLLND